MIYTFQARDGSTVEREYPMARAPRLGTRIRVKGKTYRRVLDYGARSHIAVEHDVKHAAWALTKAQAKRYCKKFDEYGHGIMVDRREIENVQARMKDDGVPLKYDFGIHGGKRG
jgi:hypothetical protein